MVLIDPRTGVLQSGVSPAKVCRRCEGAPAGVDNTRAIGGTERHRTAIASRTACRNAPSKLLRPNPIAPWELRVGKLRVFYEVVPGEPSLVRILAVGKKDRSSLRIAGQEITL